MSYFETDYNKDRCNNDAYDLLSKCLVYDHVILIDIELKNFAKRSFIALIF